MNRERWQDIIETIENSFSVEEKGKYESEEHGGTETEFIIFNGPLGRLKLEFASRPVIMDTRTKYSNRIGSDVTVNHTYSETEKSHSLNVWKWDEATEDWMAFESNLF